MKAAFRFIGKLILWCFGLSIGITVLYRFVPVPLSPLMLIRLTEAPQQQQKHRLKKQWVSYDKISPELVKAVVASEDQKFMQHSGFDFEAIEKAKKRNKSGKKRKLGGSTISMQTAKNVFLWPARNWFRKGLEAYFTVLIELLWPKQRIMEVYLNVIEMGPGIYGAEAASQHWFGKPAAKLSSREAALLAACLPDPRRRNPARPSAYISGRATAIQAQMYRLPKSSWPQPTAK
ncbi:MAG: monofunctional biosynthetic peptidoglycan transglycosylase [Bacteroidia bacterium]